LAEGTGGLLEDLRLDKSENARLLFQPGCAEGLGVPAFDHDDGAPDEWQVGRTENERQHAFRRLRMRVQDEKVNVFVFLVTRLADILAILAYEELVELEVFTDDDFAYGGHFIRLEKRKP